MKRNKFYLGIDLGGTNIKVGVVTDKGQVLHHLSLPTEAAKGPEHVLAQIKKGVKKIIELAKTDKFEAVGIGTPGSVDAKGYVRYPPNFPNWQEVPVKDEIEQFIGLPTYLDNDANVAAIGEGVFGKGKYFTDFLCITLGTGVGGGLFLNGKMYRGNGWAAGEIGHVTVDPDGPRCNCGNYGCLERLVGAKYISERAVDKIKRAEKETKILELADQDFFKITPKIITEAAVNGDQLAHAVLTETGEILGIALASVINLLNLPLIIVSGGISQAGSLILDPMRETIYKRTLPVPRKAFEVTTASLGTQAGVIGAAALAMTEAVEFSKSL
ncbi:MAG: ROK family protein [bacterium]